MMKSHLAMGAVALLTTVNAWSAVPNKKISPQVLEILNLPAENRSVVAKGANVYKDLINVAFSETQPMRVRWRALTLAAEVQREKATPDLLKASVHPQWFMRNASLVALAEVNESEGMKLAKKLLKDKALVVRSAAVDVLQKNLLPEVRDLLWEEMDQKYNFRNKESLWIRSQIVDVLAQRPNDYELKTFAKLLSDKDSRVQTAAISGVEKLTGTKLGDGKMTQDKVISLWKDYFKKENLSL